MHERVPPDDKSTDAHYAALGRVADTWAFLEFEIDQAIWALTDPANQALIACITAQLIGVNNRMRAFRSLVNALGGSSGLDGEIRKFEGTLGRLQTKRHRTVHDPRMLDRETQNIDRMEITARGELSMGWKAETIESLVQVREEIENAIGAFRRLQEKVDQEFAALPPTLRPRLPRISRRTGRPDRTTDDKQP